MSHQDWKPIILTLERNWASELNQLRKMLVEHQTKIPEQPSTLIPVDANFEDLIQLVQYAMLVKYARRHQDAVALAAVLLFYRQGRFLPVEKFAGFVQTTIDDEEIEMMVSVLLGVQRCFMGNRFGERYMSSQFDVDFYSTHTEFLNRKFPHLERSYVQNNNL